MGECEMFCFLSGHLAAFIAFGIVVYQAGSMKAINSCGLDVFGTSSRQRSQELVLRQAVQRLASKSMTCD